MQPNPGASCRKRLERCEALEAADATSLDCAPKLVNRVKAIEREPTLSCAVSGTGP